MSIFEKPKKVLKKGYFLEGLDHNAQKYRKRRKKIVMTKFIYILRKRFRSIFCHQYMNVNSDKITSNYINDFYCEICDFKCCKKGDWNRHILTAKHIKLTIANEFNIKNKYECQFCNKTYESRNGIWKHSKICNTKIDDIMNVNNEPSDRQSLSIHKKKCAKFVETEETNNIKDELHIPNETMEILSLFKEQLNENKELRKMLIEQNKQLNETNNKLLLIAKERGPINSNNNNCNNKTFNLQVYLNETCKDAINLTDFVDSIKVQIKDLEKVGEKGYAEGISDIFINNLQQLNTHSRPIHCSDSKRETLYIKDENHWLKDDEEKTNLTKAIKQVANKNIKQISEWQKLHPKYKDPESKQNDKYMQIVLNSMSGSTNEEASKNYEKIIKNVIKETVIDKCL